MSKSIKLHLQHDFNKWQNQISFCGFKGSKEPVNNNMVMNSRYVWFSLNFLPSKLFLEIINKTYCHTCLQLHLKEFPYVTSETD